MRNKLLFILAFAAVLCSCNREKPYTINGVLDLPEQIPFGDTIIDVPSFENTWVYLLELDNQMVDSAMIKDNQFTFEGKVRNDDCHYLQLTSQLGSTLVVIEPGDIDVYIDGNITVSGTPSNDAMSDVDAAMQNINTDAYDYLSQVKDSIDKLPEDEQMAFMKQLSDEFQSTLISTLDSLYQNNKDNLAGPYAVFMSNMDVQSSAEYEENLNKYPESVRNNELIQFSLRSLRQYEQLMSGFQDFQADSLSLMPE